MTKRYWHDLVDGTLVENIPLAELTTDPATSITADTATLGGSVDTLEGNTGNLDYFFEWGEVGAGFPNSTTASSTSTAPITYTTDISGLSQNTDYEFRAAGTVDGETFTGGTQTFTTQSAIPDSAVHQWKFDEGSGSTATDSVGSNDVTVNGAVWASVSDLVGGYGLDFDGTDDDVTYATIDSIIGTEQQFSVTITANLDDLSADQTILGHTQGSDASNRVEIGTSESGSVFTCSTFDGSNILSTSTTSADSIRQRIGVRHDGNTDTIDIFINGTEVSDGTVRTSLAGTSGFRVGANAAGVNNAAGVLDNLIIYNHLLSDTEFTDDYNNQPWS